MDSNHSKLYNELLALVIGRYEGIHAEVNTTGTGVGMVNGRGKGSGRPAWAERDKGDGEREGPDRAVEGSGRGDR